MKTTGKFIIFFIALLVLNSSAYAVDDPLCEAVTHVDKAVVEVMLAKGANVNAKCGEYDDPLLHKAFRMDMVELLISKGANVNAKNKQGSSKLHYSNSRDIAELLIAKGAKVNDRNMNGNTPLHGVDTKDVAELLIAKGADVNARGYNGQTPLRQAKSKDIAEFLIAKGADVNAKDDDGDTPLHFSGTKDIAELLLAKGADVNAKNRHGETPLHKEAMYGHTQLVELLLAKGANINAKDTSPPPDDGSFVKDAPLHKAASHGEKDVVEILLAKGADINIKDSSGDTPLNKAASEGHENVVGLLLAKGADIDAKNKYGYTALENAKRSLANKFFGRGSSASYQNIVAQIEEYSLKQARLLADNIKSNPRAALVQLTAQLTGNPVDDTTRRLIIKLASELKPSPAIPEEARKHFVEGTAIVKAAKNPAQQAIAAQSFIEALKIAPWWGDAYYNLGVAQELAEKYNEAEQAFNFYLLSNPSAAEKREVQDRIYGLSAKRKLAGMK